MTAGGHSTGRRRIRKRDTKRFIRDLAVDILFLVLVVLTLVTISAILRSE